MNRKRNIIISSTLDILSILFYMLIGAGLQIYGFDPEGWKFWAAVIIISVPIAIITLLIKNKIKARLIK